MTISLLCHGNPEVAATNQTGSMNSVALVKGSMGGGGEEGAGMLHFAV